MGLLKGRLGLDSARVPHADRHGVIWLSRGNLYVDDEAARFTASGNGDLPAGDYGIPIQTVTALVLGPSSPHPRGVPGAARKRGNPHIKVTTISTSSISRFHR